MAESLHYTLENWYARVEFPDAYDYESLLGHALGDGHVLWFDQEYDYQGRWAAIVTDGRRIGLIDGYFGSCSECDALQDCNGSGDYSALAEDYMRTVRTFSSWEAVRAYLTSLDQHDWAFRTSRIGALEFVNLELPLAAAPMFVALTGSDPNLDPALAVQAAVASS